MQKARLVLEDGTHFTGKSFGACGETHGEVVFNTCMTGYQEVLTDPSYKGQIVVMTYPLIGNYGFNDEDNESYQPHVQGFVVKELCDMPSNWRNSGTPDDYFQKYSIVGICDIDTRHLTQHIRNRGSMYGIITTSEETIAALVNKAQKLSLQHQDLVSMVTTKSIRNIEGIGPRIALMDFGVKENIVRSLVALGCEVHILPSHTPAQTVLDLRPDGILLSNGPGDPLDIPYAVETVRGLLDKKPILGICLGHQLLGLALGGKTYKLKFGHHGGNHPVKDLKKNRIYITSQNHNYALREDFSKDVEVTHINFNDMTVEGFTHKELPLMSIQYHPEAAPGPLDSMDLFDEFLQMVKDHPSQN